jgi:nicotinamidase-related amidase
VKHSASGVVTGTRRDKSYLSACIRLLIEILVNDVPTHNSAFIAPNEIDLEKHEGMSPIRHQSSDLAIKENAMPQNNGRAPRSEKGLLTPDNCVVALIDHQPQMLFGTSNFDRQGIINNTVALSKSARVFDVPVVLTTVETKAFSGNLWPQIRAVFPDQEPIERSSMNSWDDKNFVAAIQKTGRKKIVLAGLWTETCVALPTVQAIHDGYEIYVVEDCCGDVSQLSHDNAMKRVIQAGAKPVTALSTMLEWQRDWALRDTYDAVMDIVKTHFGAYGIGVEYAYTMVHGAPATKFPEYVVPALAVAHK